ncbi:MAG: FAD-binding oxidoreductase [Luteimonas sp.]
MAAGQSWGRYPQAEQRLLTPARADQPIDAGGDRWLPYGNGRSYGDSCLNDGGTLVHTRRLDHYLAFDPATGLLRCESGVQLADILALVVPQGWFLPVSPGTKYVTVGGAIANDVHGKNHHQAGTFGEHVHSLELLRSDGGLGSCSRQHNAELFTATIGGLGLTGLITSAEIALRQIPGPWLATESCKFGNLEEFFALSAQSDQANEYTVAWIDCTARGAALGRGLFARGNHAAPVVTPRAPARTRLGMPFTPPLSLVNSLSLRAFNTLYWHRQWRQRRASVSHYEPFFYPLDALANWNRMYGPKGFLQYQCVVPPIGAAETTAELLRRIQASGAGSFLAVLKQFGDRPPAGLLSFPRAGTTLALDFPIDRAGSVFKLLDGLDDVVADAGGAVYPAKDARMSGRRFRQYFPAWEQFQAFIDPQVSSSFWRRVMES